MVSDAVLVLTASVRRAADGAPKDDMVLASSARPASRGSHRGGGRLVWADPDSGRSADRVRDLLARCALGGLRAMSSATRCSSWSSAAALPSTRASAVSTSPAVRRPAAGARRE